MDDDFKGIEFMHFKYAYARNSKDQNIDNYFVYTHFKLSSYSVNKKQKVITYFVGNDPLSEIQINIHLPFELNTKYDIQQLLLFYIENKT